MENQLKKQNELLEKADKALKQHKEMGESLDALKKHIEKEAESKKEECGEDEKGWKNIQEFFKGSIGKKRAEKIVTFMEMLGKKK